MCEEVEHDSVMSRGGQEEIRLTAGVKEEKGGEDRKRFTVTGSAQVTQPAAAWQTSEL